MGLCFNKAPNNAQNRVINRLEKLTTPRTTATFSTAIFDEELGLQITEDINTSNYLNQFLRELPISISDKIEISDKDVKKFLKDNGISTQEFISNPEKCLERFMQQHR